MALFKRVPVTGVTRSQKWLRGPSWLDGKDVVFDADHATQYQLVAEPRLGVELMRVHPPADAVAFATRFGLLRGTDGNRNPSGLIRQPAKELIAAGHRLAVATRMILDIRKAERQPRNRKALIARIKSPLPSGGALSDRDLLNDASGWAAWEITDGFGGSSPFFFSRVQQGEDASPGEFKLAVVADDLLAACHLI